MTVSVYLLYELFPSW